MAGAAGRAVHTTGGDGRPSYASDEPPPLTPDAVTAAFGLTATDPRPLRRASAALGLPVRAGARTTPSCTNAIERQLDTLEGEAAAAPPGASS